jgi:hypothetical protein
MRLLSSLVSFSDLKNRQSEQRCLLAPQTGIAVLEASVGVPLEREKWEVSR